MLHLVGVVQMVRANPDRKFSLGFFAYHLYKTWTNRFSHVNGKQPGIPRTGGNIQPLISKKDWIEQSIVLAPALPQN